MFYTTLLTSLYVRHMYLFFVSVLYYFILLTGTLLFYTTYFTYKERERERPGGRAQRLGRVSG
jgi:hypothetical protein